jgi:hypothetical protein
MIARTGMIKDAQMFAPKGSRVRFDGVHPVKILGGLWLDDALIAVVAHASQRRLITASAGRFLDRVGFVDIDRPGPRDWAVAAFTAARRLA